MTNYRKRGIPARIDGLQRGEETDETETWAVFLLTTQKLDLTSASSNLGIILALSIIAGAKNKHPILRG